MATKDEVRASLIANPDWTARQHAEALGCKHEYIRSTARVNGWKVKLAERVPGLILHQLSREMFALITEVSKRRSIFRDRARDLVTRAKGN